MKKLLFILLAVCLTANVFAIDLSAEIIGTFNALNGTFANRNVTVGGGEYGRIRVQGEAEKDGFGAWARLQADNSLGYQIQAHGHVYYKPMDQLAFYITRNPDGHWGLDGITRWGFYGSAGEVLNHHDWSWGAAFYGGFNTGAFLTIKPMEALEINFGLPVYTQKRTDNMLKSMRLQVKYNMGETGTIGLTYEGDHMNKDKPNDSSKIYAYFGTTAGKIGLDLGVGFRLPDEYTIKNVTDLGGGYTMTTTTTTITNAPIAIGVGAAMDLDKVNLKARMLVEAFGGSAETTKVEVRPLPPGGSDTKTDGPTTKESVKIKLELMPSMALTENITGYLSGSLNATFPDRGKHNVSREPTFGLTIFPYIALSKDAFSLYAGFRLYTANIAYTNLNWQVPLGMSISF